MYWVNLFKKILKEDLLQYFKLDVMWKCRNSIQYVVCTNIWKSKILVNCIIKWKMFQLLNSYFFAFESGVVSRSSDPIFSNCEKLHFLCRMQSGRNVFKLVWYEFETSLYSILYCMWEIQRLFTVHRGQHWGAVKFHCRRTDHMTGCFLFKLQGEKKKINAESRQ